MSSLGYGDLKVSVVQFHSLPVVYLSRKLYEDSTGTEDQ